MNLGQQTTLCSKITFQGVGTHANQLTDLIISPAPANTGILFRRVNEKGILIREYRACWTKVMMTQLCTVLGAQEHEHIATIEHVMAALLALGVDNAILTVNGPEVPILDGSSICYVKEIDRVGIRKLASARKYLEILEPVRVQQGNTVAELLPADSGFTLDVEINFPQPIIGRQRYELELTAANFRKLIAPARTFGFVNDVEALRKAGFAMGASLDNSIGLEETKILNPEGLRYPDEFVRHKLLDAIGDLALAGAPIIGIYRSYCGGHKLNNAILKELFANKTAYRFVNAPTQQNKPPAFDAFTKINHAASTYAIEAR